MDEDTRRRVFEKFYQGDTAHATEGNGLGLSLVKRIVDLCGGSVSVESAPDSGSTFTVRLPLD
jgi:signal transduction histidine kinase